MESKPVYYTRNEIAKILGFEPQRISQLIAEGIFNKEKNGKYDVDKVCSAYIRHLKENVKSKSKDEDFEELKRQKIATEVQKLELELKVREGELVNAEEILKIYTNILTQTKNNLLSIPSRIAPILADVSSIGGCQKIVENAIRESLNEIAEL